MARSHRVPVAGLVLCLALVVASSVRFQHVAAQEPRVARAEASETILMRCKTSGSRFRVTAYQGSASSPTQRSESCAENLTLLSKEGFVVTDIGHYDALDTGFAVYTLARELPRP